jgi:hypothetical protein
MQNLVKLIDIIAAFKEWTASEKFRQDAANGPDIDYGPRQFMSLKI